MKKQLTLAQINEHNERFNQGIESYSIIVEYADGSELDDMFSEQEIINPYNEQHTMFAWCPIEMEDSHAAEIATADTGRYHSWSSELNDKVDKYGYDSLAEAEEAAQTIEREMMEDYTAIMTLGFSVEQSQSDEKFFLQASPEIKSPY